MAHVISRLLSGVLTLFMISVMTFAVVHILPGDVAKMIMGSQGTPLALEGLREALGLNEPLGVQYYRWVSGILTGDWGQSLVFKSPITDILALKVKASLMLVIMSLVIALAIGVPLGVWAAVHQGKWQDRVSTTTALMGVSLPDFFWGIVLILLFARTLGWLPSSGFVDPAADFAGALNHAFLPSLALSFGLVSHLMGMTRSTMLGVLNKEFIRVARAKGLSEACVIWRYGVPNAIGPVMTVVGLQIGYLFGSIIVVESLFNYTGMGWLTYQGLLNRDVPLIQATVLVIAFVVTLSSLVVDLLYLVIDPRVRLQS